MGGGGGGKKTDTKLPRSAKFGAGKGSGFSVTISWLEASTLVSTGTCYCSWVWVENINLIQHKTFIAFMLL